YDALGRATTVVDPVGNRQRRTYDLLGRITQVAEPDGNLRSLAYDAAGNVLHAKDLQHDVRFTYQGMGRLATRREAGTTVEFKYNTEEDLTGIVNEHGHAYRFDLDERGDVAREYGFDDIRRVYTRDDAGRMIRVERASGLITFYEYDPAGRVIGVKHSDGTEESYVYREDGELIEAENSSCAVKFERDPLGRILKEWQDDYWVSSQYDEHGLRKEMRSCFGAIQKIDRNAMGDVIGMQYQDAQKDPTQTAWEARVERDQMGLEVERTLPGGIRSRWERDKLGRPVRHQILGGGGQNRDVQYEWDANDRLKKIVDAHHGTTVFEHDAVGNLASATYGDGSVDLRMPDAVGNLFRTKDRNDRKYGQAGEILESRSDEGMTRYEYDAEGNLIRKSTPQGDWLYTW
ncbi:MAG: RHS repeat protein, partial [Fuerstiella sp.]|nr:RHS repeat protein [Fuerstiella sp.]